MSDRNDRRYFVAAHHWHPQLVARNENTSRQFSTLIDRSEASQYGVSYVESSNMFSSVTRNLDSTKLPKKQKSKNNWFVQAPLMARKDIMENVAALQRSRKHGRNIHPTETPNT